MRNAIGYSTLVAALLMATSVRASGRFPQTVERDLGLSYIPPCSVCHLKGNIGPGTASTPFALSMRARGMTGGSAADLTTALAALKQDGVDDDGDGVTDVDELVAGTDPNSPGGTELAQQTGPSYGCGGGGGERRGQAPSSLMFTSAIAALVRRRRQPRRTGELQP